MSSDVPTNFIVTTRKRTWVVHPSTLDGVVERDAVRWQERTVGVAADHAVDGGPVGHHQQLAPMLSRTTEAP